MESITKNGVSTTQAKGQEQYSCFVVGAFRGTHNPTFGFLESDAMRFEK